MPPNYISMCIWQQRLTCWASRDGILPMPLESACNPSLTDEAGRLCLRDRVPFKVFRDCAQFCAPPRTEIVISRRTW
jgi:hypothetical protein